MALQVRLRHALGERVLELPERGADEPLIVGRGREAALQVPSIGVAPQHCVLFVHEGGWVVQPMAGAVTLNGERFDGPQLLQIGDVLGLGAEANAPTLEIDPFGAAEGQTGPAQASAAEAAVEPAVRPIAPVRSAAAAPVPAAPFGAVSVPAPVAARSRAIPPPAGLASTSAAARAIPAPADDSVVDADEPDSGDTIVWNTAAASRPAAGRFRAAKKPPPKTSEGAIILAIVFAVVVLGGAAIIVYKSTQKTPPPPPAVVAPAPLATPIPQEDPDDGAPTAHIKTIFQDPHGQKTGAQPAPIPSVAPAPENPNPADPTAPENPAGTNPDPATTGKAGTDSGAGAPDSKAGANADAPAGSATQPSASADEDPAWNEVISAYFQLKKQGLAIIKYDEYRYLHPGRHVKELDKWTEHAVDQLWWQRVAQLWKQRADLDGQLRQKDLDLKAQPPGDFHERLAMEKVDLQARRAAINDLLTGEMGYTNNAPPDLNNPHKLRVLAGTRDQAKYASFRRRTLHDVRVHHGQPSWDDGNS